MEIRNTTKRPLKVPLPGGKRLFLGPGASGQIAGKAIDHPPLKALVDSGEIVVVDGGRAKNTGNAGPAKGGPTAQPGSGGGAGPRRSGDR